MTPGLYFGHREDATVYTGQIRPELACLITPPIDYSGGPDFGSHILRGSSLNFRKIQYSKFPL